MYELFYICRPHLATKYDIILIYESWFVTGKMIGLKLTQTNKCNSRHKNIPTVIICHHCDKIVTAVTKYILPR